MRIPVPRILLWCVAMAAGGGVSAAARADAIVPDDAAMAGSVPGKALRLVSPLTSAVGIDTAGWKMTDLSASAATDPAPPLGAAAVRMAGVAQGAGAKGDFAVAGPIPGEVSALGLWVHLGDQANVKSAGLQFIDAQGETLLATRAGDWTGWRWVEFDLTSDDVEQAYRQEDGNGEVDLPLKNIHVVWYANQPGSTQLIVNALVAAVSGGPGGAGEPALAMGGPIDPGQPLRVPLVVGNAGDAPMPVTVTFQVQRNPRLTPVRVPDARYGTDHAAGATSWTQVHGERIETGSLTDATPRTAVKLSWGGKYTEAFQFVDLGESRRITHLAYDAGDANWVWKLDIAASADGQTWRGVPGLTGLDLHKKWGRNAIEVPEPFDARYLRLRYHHGGEAVNTFALPGRLSVYDGTADEAWTIPQVGEVIASRELHSEVAPGSLGVVTFEHDAPLATGAYLVAARVEAGGRTHLLTRRLFVMPEPMPGGELEPRIGLNSSQHELAPIHRRLGIGWVRFENFKWQMASPAPGKAVFDGIAPWYVNHDKWVGALREQGIQVLPYLFLSPGWATSAPADVKKHRAAYPPKDYHDYGDFVFQAVARYGSEKHDPSELTTKDKRSGLGLLSVYELWNEPNLSNPNWGAWVGTLEEYFEMFRIGAEAAKRADPSAKIANGGFAGVKLGLVDQLRTYTYADGKHPLDFIDVLSVHTYTGPEPPEESVVDTNVDRSGNTEGDVSHEQRLRRLDAWRDRYRPDMPIWMTETGYDSAGPRGVGERNQASYNVRNTLMMLGAGIDKVLIYRESGSRPSLYAASGLLRGDWSYKPSWFAVATLIRQIHGGGEIVKLPHPEPGVYLYGWEEDGRWNVAAWSINGDQPLALPWGGGTVTGTFGGVRRVDDLAGVTLTGMPIYLGDIEDASAVAEAVERGEAQRAQWREARRALTDAKAYLFDFGGDKHVGSMDIGGPRRFTPVFAADVYNPQRGYGFAPGPAHADHDARWIKSEVLRDSCRTTPGLTFKADVDPGRYRVAVTYTPTGPEGSVTLDAGTGQPHRLTFTKDQPQATATIEAASGPVTLTFDGYGNIASFTLIHE